MQQEHVGVDVRAWAERVDECATPQAQLTVLRSAQGMGAVALVESGEPVAVLGKQIFACHLEVHPIINNIGRPSHVGGSGLGSTPALGTVTCSMYPMRCRADMEASSSCTTATWQVLPCCLDAILLLLLLLLGMGEGARGRALVARQQTQQSDQQSRRQAHSMYGKLASRGHHTLTPHTSSR